MGGITLKNPVVNTVPTSISIAKKGVTVSGLSLSTGKKASNDVVSSFLGENLGDRAKVLDTILTSMGYSRNIARTAQDSLESIALTMSEMLGIVNSVGGSQTAVRTLNDIFQSKLQQVAKQLKTSEYDGQKLLTGKLGSDGATKARFNTKPVDVRKIGTGSYDLFQELGAKGQKNIQFLDNAKIKEGDTIRLAGVLFTMMAPENVDKNNENQIAIGATSEETLGSTITAIKNHSSEALRAFDVFAKVDDLGKLIVIQQRSQSSANIPLVVNSGQVGMVDNSQPSNYSFEFLRIASIGSWVSIAGIRFDYVANGAAGGDPTKVEQGLNYDTTGYNLRDAILNHPKTKELVDKKVLSITANNFGAVNIKSTLDQSLLQFDSNFVAGDIRPAQVLVSSATTKAVRVVFPAGVAALGDTLTVNVPGIGDQVFDIAVGAHNNVAVAVYLQLIAEPNVQGLMNEGKIAIEADYNGNLTISSNDDLNIRYTGPSATVNPAPISPNDVALIKAAIDVSSIRNIEGFIGTPKAEFRVIAQGVGNAAETLYKQSTSEGTIPGGGPVDPADSVAIVEVTIGGRTFHSTVWKSNADGNLDNKAMVFKEGISGESFTVNTRTFNPDFTSLDLANNTLATPLNNLFASTVFAQTRDLDIDTSNEKIINDEGKVIGNVTGMTVSLNSTDFTNKEIQDFKIVPNPSVFGQVIFMATISGEEFSTILDVTDLNEGASVKLSAISGDSLTINIGKGGLNSLKEPENYGYISDGIKKSLMKIGSGLNVKTGVESSDSIKLVVADLSATKLYRDNQGNYQAKLDLLTKENVRLAQEVITNALNLVRKTQASVLGQAENISQASDSLSSSIAVTKDASSSYLDTDLVKSASDFAASVKSLLASTSTLRAGANVSDAGLDIIKSAAAA